LEAEGGGGGGDEAAALHGVRFGIGLVYVWWLDGKVFCSQRGARRRKNEF
jgi:hypothetical protein